MKTLISTSLAASLLVWSACIHSMTLQSRDGEKFSGRYRFARSDDGLIQVNGSDGEILNGKFTRVGRRSFIESFEKTFGRGSIAVEGPDLSVYGNAFGGLFFGHSSTLLDSAYAQNPSRTSGTLVKGPLFYWTASLRGNRGTAMACYFIGSSHTGHGFGKCKTEAGKEYSVEF